MGGGAPSATDGREHASGTPESNPGGGPPARSPHKAPQLEEASRKSRGCCSRKPRGLLDRSRVEGLEHSATRWGEARASVPPTGSPSSVTAASTP